MPPKTTTRKQRWLKSQSDREAAIKKYAYLAEVVVGRLMSTLPDSVDREDLVSYGIVGLINALDRFDPGRGVKFETYATSVIRGAVLEALRSADWAPRSVRSKYRRLEAAHARLADALGREPTEEEMAEDLSITLDEYYQLLSDASAFTLHSLEELLLSGDIPEPEAHSNNDVSLVGPALRFEREEFKNILARAIDRLPERERQILALYYQEELTLREIGEILGVTESRICQIHTQAILRLRHRLAAEGVYGSA